MKLKNNYGIVNGVSYRSKCALSLKKKLNKEANDVSTKIRVHEWNKAHFVGL